MPVVQPGTDRFKTAFKAIEIARFLTHCQQQAIQANQAKIASLAFSIPPIPAWAVLSNLAGAHQRHFYYDPPQCRVTQAATVGLGVVVGCSTAGPTRFARAQAFIRFWQDQFVYADTTLSESTQGRFFCSATFFDGAVVSAEPICFEPAYTFVPQIQVTTQAGASAVVFNCLMTVDSDIEQLIAQIYRQLRSLTITAPLGAAKGASQTMLSKDVANFEGAVRAVLRQVHSGKLHKVVLADVMDVVAPQAVNVARSLQMLRQNHPDCTVFSVGNGRGQSFIGASPERLLSIVSGQLTTDALAGSAPRSPVPGTDIQIAQSLLSSDKERYEHRVVVDFIVRQLRSLGLNPTYAQAPQLLQLLHIQHLHTPITADLSDRAVSPLDILAKLHPTPAVAGVPRGVACQLIRQYEAFDRGLYAAPLGWIDTQGNSEFVVGIRSALIDGVRARLYAGAGIVAGSEPAKELAEIKLKLQTLLNALV